ncbi:MAG: hypothetical protein JWO85_3085 [Candidatus Eremiobacteraeota bacterium]|jgi:hypothetical protein|nr:hypothetical protein [Candidatus Eremiobacteraeota bacterium]
MSNAAALVALLALAASDPWSVGIPVQLPLSPLQADRVASKWVVEFDYARNRPTEIVYQDCIVLVNRSSSATITRTQVVFGAVDPDGKPKRPNLPLDVRETIKPGGSLSGASGCRSRGYANGDRGLWLVGWVEEVDFADGTSWHAPPENEVLAQITSALRTYNATH